MTQLNLKNNTLPLLTLSLLLLLSSCAPKSVDDHIIIRGYGLNEINFKTDLEQISNLKYLEYELERKGIILGINKNSKLTSINITSSDDVTLEGIKVGDTIDRVREKYGKGTYKEVRLMSSSETKMKFEVLLYKGFLFNIKNDTVTSITVHRSWLMMYIFLKLS